MTKRGQSDDEARRGEERFRALIENLADVVTIFEADGSVRFVSPSVERVLGYTADDRDRANVFSLIHPADAEQARGAFARVASRPGFQGPIEVRARHADGSWRVLEVSANNLLADPSVHGIVGIVRDITERKRVEDVWRFLAEASAVLGGSLEDERPLIAVADLATGRFADWCLVDLVEDGEVRRLAASHANPRRRPFAPAVQRCFPIGPEVGYGPAQVIRTGQSELVERFPAERFEAVARDPTDLDALRGLRLTSYICVPIRVRGETLGAFTFISAESRFHYQPRGVTVAEEVARRAALALENMRLYREAQEAVRVRDEFLFSVSHDLQTPLTSIKGTAQLLARGLDRGEPRDAQTLTDGLARIDAATTKMAAQIAELLDLALLESGRPLDLDRGPVDLVALARRLAAEHQAADADQRLDVQTDLPELVGSWDETRLERVIENLYSNALKYSPAGGEVAVAINRIGGDGEEQAELVVRDRGLGIPAADLPRVFERFHRGANVAGRIAGTGIGLAGVKQIVEQHGGAIHMDSVEGEGTTVTVRLPL